MTIASSASDQQTPEVSAPASDGEGALAWKTHDAQDIGELIVIAFAHGGVDRVFFTSGSDIVFYQEAIAKALARNSPAPSLISIPHEHVSLNAALGYAAVSGKPTVVGRCAPGRSNRDNARGARRRRASLAPADL